jgi:hypothetical protein
MGLDGLDKSESTLRELREKGSAEAPARVASRT